MSVILEPLIENPDSYQIAYIKTVLNKIKISDDGLSSAALSVSSNQATAANKTAYHKLYSINKVNKYFHFFPFHIPTYFLAIVLINTDHNIFLI